MKKITRPLPVCGDDDCSVMNDTPDTGLHAQPAGAVTSKLPDPGPGPKATLVGATDVTHEPGPA
jgi:hypothetical protein